MCNYYFNIDKSIRLYNDDCIKILDNLILKGVKISGVLTSPPYNNSRKSTNLKNHEGRYDIYLDQRTNEEYLEWLSDIFNKLDKILIPNGVILFNISYGVENPNVFWEFPYNLINKTNFMIADCIIWKKSTALPNNVSPNKLTRIIEYVFVICRKNEYKTFNCNKQIISQSSKGQNIYENIYNFVEAKNNDGSNPYNKATYSTDLCLDLLNKYFKEEDIILDMFNGTGTTGLACKKLNMNYIGIELSKNQFEYSIERLKGE